MMTEREKMILEKLISKKQVTVKELASELYVSEPSVRRDLAALEKRNLLKRVYGGAVIDESALSRNMIPFMLREMEQGSAKIVIAKKAADLVRDGDVIFLDASTTAYTMIPFLAGKKNVTVVTNGVRALEKLAEYEINAISTGGALVGGCLALVGDEAYKTIEAINANIAFFSCRGLSEGGYLTDISAPENNVRRMMMRRSEKSYLLLANEKKGKKYYHNLCHESELDGIITD